MLDMSEVNRLACRLLEDVRQTQGLCPGCGRAPHDGVGCGYVIHDYLHAGDRWVPWQRGPNAARRIARLMSRVRRWQLDRERRETGYLDLGGEA